jgi:hypothetical protein
VDTDLDDFGQVGYHYSVGVLFLYMSFVVSVAYTAIEEGIGVTHG